MNVLVVAAHPDDEVLGAGGTIIKHVFNKDRVTVLIVTEAAGYPDTEERKDEARKVHAFLGAKTLFGNLPTVRLDTIPQTRLNGVLENAVSEIKPEIIYTHHYGDVNKDHRLVFDATLVATRPQVEGGVKAVLSYETVSSTEWGNHAFNPDVYVDITKFLGKKLAAMKMYKRELKDYPHPRSLEAISNLAKTRGSEVCVNAAEAFKLIREIR